MEKYEKRNAPWVGTIVDGKLVVQEVSEEEYQKAIWPKPAPPRTDAKD